MTIDFAQLYLQLEIRDDCTLEEFKQACRRRIRQQHPDRRREGGGSTDTAQIALPDLLTLYAKALRFHRRHGRLPGAVAPSLAPMVISYGPRAPNAISPPTIRPSPTGVSAPVARRLSWRAPMLVLAATIAGLAGINAWNESKVVANESEAETESLPATASVAASPEATETASFPSEVATAMPTPYPADAAAVEEDGHAVAVPPRLIEIGMDAETVRSLQGEPMQREDTEWIYGPSWIRFDRGRVVDWYSSPLHRLNTETGSP